MCARFDVGDLAWTIRILVEQAASNVTLAQLLVPLSHPKQESEEKYIPPAHLPAVAVKEEPITASTSPQATRPPVETMGFVALKRAFYTLQHDPSHPISEFLSKLTALANQLKGLGNALKDDDIIDMIIYALHGDWRDISRTLMKSESRLELGGGVMNTLIEEEKRRHKQI
ncbi:gag-polypeptide of LTR copia-type [Ceratobasidium sp. AG-Ba]|nr:gag-polypeptide of LTR copia-type [Ceratobasidium sp. AG-Ba]